MKFVRLTIPYDEASGIMDFLIAEGIPFLLREE